VVTNVVLQSFDWAFLTAVHALEPNIRLCALGSGALSAATLASIINTGARTVAWEPPAAAPTRCRSIVLGLGRTNGRG